MSVRGIAIALVLLSNILQSAPAARLEDDNFSGAALDSCRWFSWSNQGTVAQTGGLQLQTSASTAFSQARVISQYAVTGDATLEVTVTGGAGFETPISDSEQMYAAFGLWAGDANYLSLALAKAVDHPVIKVLRASSTTGIPSYQSFPDIPISGPAARFRITKSGGQIVLAYNVNGSWSAAASVAEFGEPAYITLQASTVDVQRQFTATFSNFSFIGGTTTLRPYVRGPDVRRPDFISGGVVTDYIYQRVWSGQWRSVDPLQVLRDNGMKWIRTGVTTVSAASLKAVSPAQWGNLPWQNEYWSSQEAAAQVLKEAAQRGLKSNLFFFLSDTGAGAQAQNAPPEWRGLSVDETAARVGEYTQRIVSAYRAQGITIDLYDVGNEIATGILNFRPYDRIAVPPGANVGMDMTFLRTSVWPIEARLLQAAINGIRAADPAAKVVLHIAGLGTSPSDILVKAFFKAMVDNGVSFDYAGLSHPYAMDSWRVDEYSTNCWFQRMQETIDFIAGLGKRTLFSEAAYPHDPNGISGAPMADFPYSVAGQTAWVTEELRFGNNNPNVAGFMYYYPEHRPGDSSDPSSLVLRSSGLFDSSDQPLPALREFSDVTRALASNLAGVNFDGDGKSDILWRNTNGQVAIWLMNGMAQKSGAIIAAVSTDWAISGTGDFDGDGKSDILWRNSNGQVAIWLMNGIAQKSSAIIATVSTDWTISGTGDFDGDGKTDILWRNSNGQVAIWLMNGLALSSGAVIATVGNGWKITDSADFDGDGKADILWRNSNGQVAIWLMNGMAQKSGAIIAAVSTDWAISGTGDFDGDGKADILWRNVNGEGAIWLMNGMGQQSAGSLGVISNDWKVATVGDFDGDGKADVLWRNDNGQVAIWLINGVAQKSSALLGLVSTDWRIASGAAN